MNFNWQGRFFHLIILICHETFSASPSMMFIIQLEQELLGPSTAIFRVGRPVEILQDPAFAAHPEIFRRQDSHLFRLVGFLYYLATAFGATGRHYHNLWLFDDWSRYSYNGNLRQQWHVWENHHVSTLQEALL